MAHLLTYEKICRALVKAARRAGLHAFGEEHILEFHTAGRSFEFFCVPKGYGPPYHRRARISFFWSPEQHVRVYSIEDDVEEVDSNDSIDEVADSDIEDREALDDLSFIELVVDYDIIGTSDEQELSVVSDRAEHAYRLVLEHLSHDNQPVLHTNTCAQPGGRQFVEQCHLTYYWEVDIYESSFDTSTIMDEVGDVLGILIENDDSPGTGGSKSPRPRFPRFSDN